jgi:hypothetical protein
LVVLAAGGGTGRDREQEHCADKPGGGHAETFSNILQILSDGVIAAAASATIQCQLCLGKAQHRMKMRTAP